jgi:nucleotide-binding universal stress UspA family protein
MPDSIRTVVVAVDGSDPSFKAVRLGADIAAKYGARLHLVHVIPEGDIPDPIRRFAESEHLSGPPYYVRYRYIGENILRTACDEARKSGVSDPHTIIVDGDPATTILRYARENAADMIFVGCRGLSDAAGMILGSVSHKVTHLADCSVVAVR